MAKTTTLSRVPSDTAQAVAEAERELQRVSEGKGQQVQIKPSQITTRPLLFQPRSFGNNNALDAEHVKKLERRISTKGELDPPLVVRLGKKWVCVDGHHRIAAYLKTSKYGYGSHHTIICDWFPGDVRDAVDESIRRNDIDKLEMRSGDRYEAAWQRVVLDWGSKSEIVALANVSDGLVGTMRRVKTAYEERDKFGKELRKKLPGGLEKYTWSAARQAYLDLKPADWEPREAGAKLAKTLRNRVQSRLSDNPIVTAHALMIYDPTLPQKLISALTLVAQEAADEEYGYENATADPRYRELLQGLLKASQDAQQKLAKRIEELQAKLTPTRAEQPQGFTGQF